MKIKISNSTLSGDIYIPGSKSHTVRAICVALMAEGTSVIRNPLVSDDTLSCLYAIQKLGAEFKETVEKGVKVWSIKGTGGKIHNETDEIIDLGNSGTSLRLLAGLIAAGDLRVAFDGDGSLRGRPMGPLISALEKLKVTVHSSEGGKCPLTVGGPLEGGMTVIDGKSSQFVSSLLFAAPLAHKNDTEILVININETPYIDITLEWLDLLNIKYEMKSDYSYFKVKCNQKYKAFDVTIPADFSTATFALLGAAVTGGDIRIYNLDFEDKQGDKVVFDHFRQLGLSIEHNPDHVRVYRKRNLIGETNFDLNDTPDALPAMAVAAAFADGKVILRNVPHARLKETDRISAMAAELKKIGINTIEKEDGLEIISTSKPKTPKCELDGYDDHRIIMSLIIAAMGLKGETIIDNAGAISVTYPSFIKDFKKLGAEIETIK